MPALTGPGHPGCGQEYRRHQHQKEVQERGRRVMGSEGTGRKGLPAPLENPPDVRRLTHVL